MEKKQKQVLELSPVTNREELTNRVNDAIATLLGSVGKYDCIEDVQRISEPLLLVRLLLLDY